MNPIAEEIESYLGSASMTDEEYLAHYGMPRRSGRYPWGSGQDPYQSSRDFLGRVEQMRKSGFTYTDENGKKWTGDNAIAKSLGYNSTDFRTVYAIAKDERRSDMVATAKRLRDKEGMNNSEIGRKMGINESSVRSLLDPNSESRMKQARETAKFLKDQVDKKGMVDVGAGVNNDLKITKEKLDQALFILQAEGNYEVYGGRFSQVTNKGQMTTQRVLCTPGTPHSAIYDYDKVKTVKANYQAVFNCCSRRCEINVCVLFAELRTERQHRDNSSSNNCSDYGSGRRGYVANSNRHHQSKRAVV